MNGKKVFMKIKRLISISMDMFLTKRYTFCPLLWSDVFIKPNGDIFCCCHSLPGSIGNIYKNDLSTIWKNSYRLKFYRFLSSKGFLHCYRKCTIYKSVDNYVNYEYPNNVWILFGEKCNLRCIMCRQNHKSNIILELEKLKQQVSWDRIKKVVLQGGEIFVMKDAGLFCRWLTSRKTKRLGIITNGTLLYGDWIDFIIKHFSKISISVNAATAETHELVNYGSSFNTVIDNIKKLIRLKKIYKTDIEIVYKYTIVPENYSEIADAVIFADNLGCDKIEYGFDKVTIFDFIKNNRLLHNEIISKMKSVKERKLDIVISSRKLKYLGIV